MEAEREEKTPEAKQQAEEAQKWEPQKPEKASWRTDWGARQEQKRPKKETSQAQGLRLAPPPQETTKHSRAPPDGVNTVMQCRVCVVMRSCSGASRANPSACRLPALEPRSLWDWVLPCVILVSDLCTCHLQVAANWYSRLLFVALLCSLVRVFW